MKKTVRILLANKLGTMQASFTKLTLMMLAVLATSSLCAQTYTTRAAGNWTSASTWENGAVPSRTISSSMTVNIRHAVTADLSGDLSISGRLNIEGDTLRFTSSYSKKVIVAATGLLLVKKGGFLQHMSTHNNDFDLNGGRLVVDSAVMQVSKNLTATAGSRKFIRSSSLTVGEGYSLDASSSNKSFDTIQNATLHISAVAGGSLDLKKDATLRVANAVVKIGDGDFKVASGAAISVLTGAASNLGFNQIKVSKDLDNAGTWNARIDAHCIDGNIKGGNMADIDFTRSEDCSDGNSPAAPELVFTNPVLKSGNANKEGAVYRFANVTTGIDAEIKLKKFSRNDIVMRTIDNSTLGWTKAFQPEFGLPGVVQPNQHWYIDFEMTFYKAGTNQKQKVAKFDLTALDVDGDGLSVREYATFENPANIIYSTVSYLTNQSAGLIGQSFTCPHDGVLSPLAVCLSCGGDGKGGLWNIDDCTDCEGVGLKYALCSHSYDGVNGSTLSGPVENFTNIDTLATQVMATYQYVDRDNIKFRYGGRSGQHASNGAGIRLNSLWFRQFSMAPPPQMMSTLPVKLTAFEAILNNKDVQLSWTGFEENFSHYTVQRSTDGKNYSDVAVVFGNNHATASSTYRFKDANVVSASGVLYYRLVMIDKDDETSGRTSEVRVIRLKENTTSLVTAYPNPVKDAVRLTLPAAWQGKGLVIEVFSANGNRVQNRVLGNASQTETLNLGALPKGMYTISVTCEGEVAQQRVVKQ